MKYLYLTNSAYGLDQTLKRYLPPFLNSPKRPGPKKIFNVLRAELERRKKKTILSSSPFILHIEPTNYCNLRCPNCKTGTGMNTQEKGNLKFEDFKKVIDDLKDKLILVRLDGVGESLLNKDFIKMVRYASDCKIITSVSTNFVSLGKPEIDELVDSGLDYLIISLDGATKEVYEKIRVGAKFEKIIENIKYLVEAKNKRKQKTPFIETQFILFKDQNAEELQPVKDLSLSLGVDRLLVKTGNNDLSRLNVADISEVKGCYWLYYVPNVDWQGNLKVCCISGLASSFSFGNIIQNNAKEEWNNESMRGIRKLFAQRDDAVIQNLKGCLCLRCYKLAYLNKE